MYFAIPQGTGSTFITNVFDAMSQPFASRPDVFDAPTFKKRYLRAYPKDEIGFGYRNFIEFFKDNERNVLFATWGARCLLREIQDKVIWFVRDPVKAYASFYRTEEDRKYGWSQYPIAQMDPNDPRTINEAMFGPQAFILRHLAVARSQRQIVRFDNMVNDVMNLKCPKAFKKWVSSLYLTTNKDPRDVLSDKTINYIKQMGAFYYEWRKKYDEAYTII